MCVAVATVVVMTDGTQTSACDPSTGLEGHREVGSAQARPRRQGEGMLLHFEPWRVSRPAVPLAYDRM